MRGVFSLERSWNGVGRCWMQKATETAYALFCQGRRVRAFPPRGRGTRRTGGTRYWWPWRGPLHESNRTAALIENVSTVLADKHGNRLESFRQALADGGYHVEKVVLDSSEFGVPQKRKRAFFFVTREALNLDRITELLERHKVPPVTTQEALHGLPTPTVRPDTYDDEAEVEGPANHFAMRHSERDRWHGSFNRTGSETMAPKAKQFSRAAPPPNVRSDGDK